MDRFGLGYLALALVLFTVPVHTCGVPEVRQDATGRQAVSSAPSTGPNHAQGDPAPPAKADVVAVIQSGDSTFRVLVGEDRQGRVWSAAFDDTLPSPAE